MVKPPRSTGIDAAAIDVVPDAARESPGGAGRTRSFFVNQRRGRDSNPWTSF
jgi:hypothetical protein